MDQTKETKIRLLVNDEETLYLPFSPEPEFRESVKRYIRGKTDGDNRNLSMTVTSRKPMNEERFRSAVSAWAADEKRRFKIEERNNLRTLIGLLAVGSVMLMLSLALLRQYDVVSYTLLPVMSSLALSKAAGILLLTMPTLKAQRVILGEIEKRNVITFEIAPETEGGNEGGTDGGEN